MIWLCIDPQHLNGALKRRHYPLPVIDDVLPELDGVKVFSKAYLSEGFMQCELDDKSSLLTTFNSPGEGGDTRECPMGLAQRLRFSAKVEPVP